MSDPFVRSASLFTVLVLGTVFWSWVVILAARAGWLGWL